MTRHYAKIISILFAVLGGAACIYGVLSGAAQTGLNALVRFILDRQSSMEGVMQGADGTLGASPWTLITLSFVYGLFHAIGPGHGKAVICAYVLSHKTRLRRTLGLSFGAAFGQAFSAILLGSFLSTADEVLTPISFAVVTVMGVYLLVQSILPLIEPPSTSLTLAQHSTQLVAYGGTVPPEHVHETASVWHAVAIALAIAIRPCTGAALVLGLTFTFGFVFSGIIAVLAMALGTALVVSSVAVGAHYLRWPLTEILSAWGVRGKLLTYGLMMLGSLIITVFGATVLFGSLTGTASPFFSSPRA